MSRQHTTISGGVLVAALVVASGSSHLSIGHGSLQARAAQPPGRGRNGGDSAAPARKTGEGVGPFPG